MIFKLNFNSKFFGEQKTKTYISCCKNNIFGKTPKGLRYFILNLLRGKNIINLSDKEFDCRVDYVSSDNEDFIIKCFKTLPKVRWLCSLEQLNAQPKPPSLPRVEYSNTTWLNLQPQQTFQMPIEVIPADPVEPTRLQPLDNYSFEYRGSLTNTINIPRTIYANLQPEVREQDLRMQEGQFLQDEDNYLDPIYPDDVLEPL